MTQTTQQATAETAQPTANEQPTAKSQEQTASNEPAPNSAFISDDKLRAYTSLDNSSMGEWDWQALQLGWNTAQLDDLIKWT